MIEELNNYSLSLYPSELCHFDPPEVLAQDDCIMLGAYKEFRLVGIGAVKLFDDYGEFKRMFVPELERGLGIAAALLQELIAITKKKICLLFA